MKKKKIGYIIKLNHRVVSYLYYSFLSRTPDLKKITMKKGFTRILLETQQSNIFKTGKRKVETLQEKVGS